LPREFTLDQNYPNPFNPATVIGFTLAEPAQVSISIYNVRGRRVAELVDALYGAGTHRIGWDGTSENGHRVSSGVYFYRLSTKAGDVTRSMVLLR
jgi:flagellar hook assembly protein FlgD